MRTNLKVFRVKRNLTQEEIAKKIGFARATYTSIERGERHGRNSFWKELQKAFGISDADMWELMKNE